MLLTRTLLDNLHRVFHKEPDQFLALRLAYDGQMTWTVEDFVLTTTVAGGTGTSLTVDLTQYDLDGLVAFLAAQTGYSVPTTPPIGLGGRSATVLLDASGDQALSNGDHLFGYTSLLYEWLEAMARELTDARLQIVEMLKQMAITTAALEWIDEWGGYFGIPRDAGESDADYGPRIVEEVLRVRSNNRALEDEIQRITGYKVDVVDLRWRAQLLHTNRPLETTNNPAYPVGAIIPGSADRAFLASLGITADRPLWGPPANNNALVCAFAVLLGVDVSTISAVDLASIKRIVSTHRSSGTIGLYFAPAALLHTNTAGETANAAGFYCGPKSASYQPIVI